MADDDDTIVPAVPDDPDDRTIVVERDDPDERTVVIERGAPDERTVVIDRGRRKGASTPDADPVLAVLPSPRGIRPAPVDAEYAQVVPSAPAAYGPRQLAPAPRPGPAAPRGLEPARRGELPSVGLRSRRSGTLALLVFAGACAVSVIGIVAVIVWFVRG